MENLSLIAAIGLDNELGYNNSLIWKIPEDLKFYKSMTMNKNIIMGRNTLESMPLNALKGRIPLVLTSKKLQNFVNVDTFDSIDKILNYVSENPNKEFMVVGGAKVYEELLPYVNTMYLTEIKKEAYADTFFPYYNEEDWVITEIGDYLNEDIPYVRNKYVRKKVIK